MPFSRNDALNVFLSYASEDGEIADALARALRAAFVSDIEVTMMSEFPSGVNWRRLIGDSIEQTDLMVAIATGRLKPSHSFTGVEVGMFEFSRRDKAKMARFQSLDRRMIPFAVLARVPDTMNEFEGIDIDPSDLRDVRFDTTTLASNLKELDEGQGASDSAPHRMMYKLFADIEDIVYQAKERKRSMAENQDRIEALQNCARALCQEVFRIILNREKHVEIPKSKLVIRLEPNAEGNGRQSIEQAGVRIEGPCREAFGFPDNEPRLLTWEQFIAKADDKDVAYGWRESLSSLISSTEDSQFVDSNVILSFDRRKIFRVFVARKSILYSNAAEYQIYVLEMLRMRDQGDPDTTILLKALEVGLGYRFMFLESRSEFSPQVFKVEDGNRIKKRVGNLITYLTLLLQTVDEYKLNDPQTVLRIMGIEVTDTINENYKIWNREKAALYDAAKTILKINEVSNADREGFINVLTGFCDLTRKMNQEYTAAVLGHLQKRVGASEPGGVN